MLLKIFNSLSRKVEVFKPNKYPQVGMYTCGPTVYDFAHIGNFRTYILSDIVQRTLKYLGFRVKSVMNITDVGHLTSDADTGEDKLEKGARREGKTAWDIAEKYTKIFLSDAKKLNILAPTVLCKATDHIKEQVELVRKLEEKGYTYKTSDGIYFDTSKFPNYAKLAKLDLKGLKEGARVEKNPEKKNFTDFALWKFSPKGKKRDMEWMSPWGKGFPGWHLECSAMAMKYLGETFDIHLGGVDLKPVHHTNEIAQSEAVTGKKFVRFWLHGEFVLVDNKKMSKSKGNFYNLKDIEEKGFDPLALRYLYLNTHYRSKMNFTWKGLEGAQRVLDRLRENVGKWDKKKEHDYGLSTQAQKWNRMFKGELAEDLNMPGVLGALWLMIRDKQIPGWQKYELLKDWDKVLGLKVDKEKKVEEVNEGSKKLIEKREKLRKQKKWQEADKIRKEIQAKGFIIKDTSKGTVVEERK
ncbi:MAG TPA: cysteine--tRNA ligase [Candidatus Bathyarchaeia archaeon]|nr:cysteine--tRNA ligase [Candidatus Bathyarchaeia archaeon]